jgi:hypothetical protein
MSDDEIGVMDAALRRMFAVGKVNMATGNMTLLYGPRPQVPAMVGIWQGKIAVYLLPPEEDA